MTTEPIHWNALTTAERNKVVCEEIGIEPHLTPYKPGYMPSEHWPNISEDLNVTVNAIGQNKLRLITYENGWQASTFTPGEFRQSSAEAGTPAHAICIALLRSKGRAVKL